MSGDTRGGHSSPCLLSVVAQGAPEDLLAGPAGSCPSSPSPLCSLPLIPSSPPKLSLSLCVDRSCRGAAYRSSPSWLPSFLRSLIKPPSVSISAYLQDPVRTLLPPLLRTWRDKDMAAVVYATRSANSGASSTGSRPVVPISFRFRSQPRASIAMAAGLFVSPRVPKAFGV